MSAVPVPVPQEPAAPASAPVRRRRGRTAEPESRGISSAYDRRVPGARVVRALVSGGLLVLLVVVALGPILWLAKSAVTPTQDTLRDPIALWPHGIDWANLRTAWVDIDLERYFANTVVIAIGSWAVQMLVAVTGGYVLSVLRPPGSRLLYGLVLGTMFVPAVVLLVPLYLTALDVPLLHVSLVNTYWGAFLPAGASAFNVAIVKRFFDNLPREIIDAARVDGCGDFRLFFSIVLPMSKPVLGVVSVFAVLAAWKDFIWPLVVLPDPAKQPLSVRLPRLANVTELDVLLAALLISCIVPIAFFLVFQRMFLRGGLEGAVKG
ncbi:carbohydrate ABC transporter permease [Nocardioides sp. CER19]|uniref:carbohydrate ABC transporter permease n=1 Tax=Nocardioides sp. CER19 TaxID=3038538 RepID=UPI002449DC69|nr:carbohydrate ABC transporter permease [Nocardioides sp. CER19]MDH2415733.1 carbohydrate ABC transporter permease [Nocardioides sp. CER19]